MTFRGLIIRGVVMRSCGLELHSWAVKGSMRSTRIQFGYELGVHLHLPADPIAMRIGAHVADAFFCCCLR